jgi:pyruvate,water dikinase
MPTRFIRWFSEIGINDVALVGGKNASLGEMYRELACQGIRVPNSFAITADGYRHFLATTGSGVQLRTNLAGLDNCGPDALRCDRDGLRWQVTDA